MIRSVEMLLKSIRHIHAAIRSGSCSDLRTYSAQMS